MLVDMLPHDRDSYRQQMGHVWLGFSDEHMQRLLNEQRFRGREDRFAAAGREGQGSGIVCRNRDEATTTRKHEIGLVRSAAL